MALISTSNFTGQNITGQYASVSLTGAVNLRASHTFMCRVKHGSTATNYDSIVVCYENSTVNFSVNGIFLGRNNGGAGTSIFGNRQNDNFSPTVNTATLASCYGNTSTWYHLTVAYDATNNTIRTYVDGVASGTVASTTTLVPSSTSTIFLVGLHNGKMADAALFNRLLTPTEIANMAAYRVPQVTSGLSVFWRLDANANDSSGNGKNGATGGSSPNISYSTADNPPQPETPTVSLAGDAATSSALAGKLSSLVTGSQSSTSALAGSLNTLKPIAGSASSSSALAGALQARVQGNAATTSALGAWIRPRWGRRTSTTFALSRSSLGFNGATPWTFMTWARSIVSGDNSALLTATNAIAGVGPYFGSIRLSVNDSSGAAVFDDFSVTNDGQWHHLAISYDGTTARGYVDGSLIVSGAGVINEVFGLVRWGSNSATAEWAHTKLFTTQLSAAKILSEATYSTPHEAPAFAWWQLAWNNVTLDSTGNGNTLTDASSIEAQTESPGIPLTLIAGSAASTSALAGSLNTLKPLAGAAATTSALAGKLSALLTGNAASTSALAGQLQALLSGSAASTSALAGSLTAQIVGNPATASALAGALQALITGSTATSSALSGTLGISGQFAGNTASISALAGTLAQAVGLTGPAASTSALAGALQALLRGDATSSSALAAALTVYANVAGNAASLSALQGQLTAQIAASASSTSALAAALRIANALAGQPSTASALAGGLTVFQQVALASAAASSSALRGSLNVTVNISGRGDTYVSGRVSPVYFSSDVPDQPRRRPWPPRPR